VVHRPVELEAEPIKYAGSKSSKEWRKDVRVQQLFAY